MRGPTLPISDSMSCQIRWQRREPQGRSGRVGSQARQTGVEGGVSAEAVEIMKEFLCPFAPDTFVYILLCL